MRLPFVNATASHSGRRALSPTPSSSTPSSSSCAAVIRGFDRLPGLTCEMEVAETVSESLPSPHMRRCSACEGFALISLMKHSFTWDTGLSWRRRPFIYLSKDEAAPGPILPVMECETGSQLLSTNAIILLNEFSSLFWCRTQMTRNAIPSFLRICLYMHSCPWLKKSKEHNHLSVWLLFGLRHKERETNKYS